MQPSVEFCCWGRQDTISHCGEECEDTIIFHMGKIERPSLCSEKISALYTSLPLPDTLSTRHFTHQTHCVTDTLLTRRTVYQTHCAPDLLLTRQTLYQTHCVPVSLFQTLYSPDTLCNDSLRNVHSHCMRYSTSPSDKITAQEA